jgi:hypothetical protein
MVGTRWDEADDVKCSALLRRMFGDRTSTTDEAAETIQGFSSVPENMPRYPLKDR